MEAQAFQSLVKTQALSVKSALSILGGVDMTPCYELDKRLKADPALLAEFINDPVGISKREVGFIVPPEAHAHFVNEKNEYFPAEGDAIAQLMAGKSGNPWSRVEVRAAVGPGCYVLCIACL